MGLKIYVGTSPFFVLFPEFNFSRPRPVVSASYIREGADIEAAEKCSKVWKLSRAATKNIMCVQPVSLPLTLFCLHVH